MSITPSECDVLTGAEQKQISEYEISIDRMLREHYKGPGRTLYWPVPRMAMDRVVNRLIIVYKHAGWHVEDGSSAEAGGASYLKFVEE